MAIRCSQLRPSLALPRAMLPLAPPLPRPDEVALPPVPDCYRSIPVLTGYAGCSRRSRSHDWSRAHTLEHEMA